MSCCEPQGADGVPNGICKECGSETVDGLSVDRCGFSAEQCLLCGCAPCDESC